MFSMRRAVLLVALITLSVVIGGAAYAVDYFAVGNNYGGVQVYTYNGSSIYFDQYLGASYPVFTSFASNGDLYAAELGAGYVRKYENQSGTFTLTNSIAVSNPYGVLASSSGNLYITNEDWPNGVGGLLKYDGTTVTTIDPSLAATVTDIAEDASGKLWVGSSSGWLNSYDASNAMAKTSYYFGAGITGMTFGPDASGDGGSDLYIGGAGTGWIKIFNPVTGLYVGDYLADGTVSSVGDIVFTADGTKSYFTSPGANKAYSYDGTTVNDATTTVYGSNGFFGLSYPIGIALSNSYQPVAAVPEPGSLLSLGAMLLSGGIVCRRRAKR